MPSTPARPPRRKPGLRREPFGIDNVITVDMGGTSFDITLSKSGRTNFSKDTDFLRYRIGVPMIQVETLGAGGGSIAHLDDFGMLQVGPRSAGATPARCATARAARAHRDRRQPGPGLPARRRAAGRQHSPQP
jgi:N-methylhydantoinase A/oxoprolinase/acetone carboxylase beta subunit